MLQCPHRGAAPYWSFCTLYYPACPCVSLLCIGRLQEVYMKNHEIATHTLHHVADPGACSRHLSPAAAKQLACGLHLNSVNAPDSC